VVIYSKKEEKTGEVNVMKFKKLIVLGSVVASLMVMSQSAFAFACATCDKKCTPGQGCQYFNCREIPCTDANTRG
jgi:hypothetical protein